MPKIMQHLSRGSIVAATVLTYADVHVALPVVAFTAGRKDRGMTQRGLRRNSTVQIQARTSVHEVIWIEDCSSSSPSPGQGMARLSQQLTRTQNDPLKRSFKSRPLWDLDYTLSDRHGFPKGSTVAGTRFANRNPQPDVRNGNSSTTVTSQKLCKWSWKQLPQQNNTHHEAVVHCGSSEVGDEEGLDDILPSEVKMVARGEDQRASSPHMSDRNGAVRIHVKPATMIYRQQTELEINNLAGGVGLPNRWTPSTLCANARPTVHCAVSGKEQRSIAKGPKRMGHVKDKPYARPFGRDILAAGSAIGSSSRVRRRPSEPYQRSLHKAALSSNTATRIVKHFLKAAVTSIVKEP